LNILRRTVCYNINIIPVTNFWAVKVFCLVYRNCWYTDVQLQLSRSQD